MPFPVDNIRIACKKRGTTLAQVERDLAIGNGVIAKWEKKKGYPPYDRIMAIAEHLNVPISELTGEEQKENPVAGSNEVTVSDEDLKHLTAFHAADEDTKTAIRILLAKYEKEKQDGN